MENLQEAKQHIAESKNIYIVPDQSNPEAIACSLALFYTLKDLSKNVNIVIDQLPEGSKGLAPSLDFISLPKNFVISIPKETADITQIYYEKNEEALKIHLTVDSGNIKKENVSFYFSNPKPDLVITIGVKNFKKYLEEKLDPYGFLMEADILNIDNGQNNEKFGKINILEDRPLLETTVRLINNLH